MATKTFNYQANSQETYFQLAAYAVTLPVTVTLFPKYLTVAIPEQASDEVCEFINDNSINVTVTDNQFDDNNAEELLYHPTTDATILREIAVSFQEVAKSTEERCKETLNEYAERSSIAEKDSQQYNRWWQEASQANSRIRKQIKAIGVLIDSITHEQ